MAKTVIKKPVSKAAQAVKQPAAPKVRSKYSSAKMTIPQRVECKTKVAELYMRGYSSRRVSRDLKEIHDISVSPSTVCVMFKEVATDLRERYEKQTDALFWLNLERYNNLEAEMWDAWEASKKQRKKTISKRTGAPINNPNNTGVRGVRAIGVSDSEELSDGRGDPRYAAIIKDCIDMRMEWIGKLKFGIQPEGMQTVNNTNNNVMLVINTPQLSPKMAAMEAQVINQLEQPLN